MTRSGLGAGIVFIVTNKPGWIIATAITATSTIIGYVAARSNEATVEDTVAQQGKRSAQ
jgi:hypothetical protein